MCSYKLDQSIPKVNAYINSSMGIPRKRIPVKTSKFHTRVTKSGKKANKVRNKIID